MIDQHHRPEHRLIEEHIHRKRNSISVSTNCHDSYIIHTKQIIEILVILIRIINSQIQIRRSRPTLKPSGAIVSKAVEFVDIYRNLPIRPDPLYPQPIPDKTAAKCRKDVCLLPDCYCGGKEVPGNVFILLAASISCLTFY